MSSGTDVVVFRVSDHGILLVTRDQGAVVRGELLRVLREHGGDTVEVHLDGVDTYTPSFMDELLGKTLVEIGRDAFRDRVRLVATRNDVQKLANLVLNNRLASLRGPAAKKR
jgi:hypothetical protein